MANYLILGCDEVTSLVVDSGENTLTPGNIYFINFTGETSPACFTVIEESTDPIENGVSDATNYNNCLECLQQNNWSFIVEVCGIPDGGPVSANQFNEWPLGGYYKLCPPPDFVGDLPDCFCVNVVGISGTGLPPIFEISGPFESCDCEDPRSASTETFLCEQICTESGTTVVSVVAPHPVWTDGYGTAVTQMNMITLGGNGLNS